MNEEREQIIIERLIRRIEKANTYVLKEIGRSIKQIGTINPTKARQLIQTLKYGGNFNKIVKQISKLTDLNVNEIYEVFDQVTKIDYDFAEKFYKYKNIKHVPYEQNQALMKQARALAKITANEYANLTKTSALGLGLQNKQGKVVFKSLKESYYDLLDQAVLNVSQGKEAFDNAMYRQLKTISENGLKVIYPTTYIDKNGVKKHHTRRLDSAFRMNMKSALRNLHNEIQKQIGKDIDADGVEISVHANPAEDHQFAQGRQFTNKQFQKLQTTGSAITYDNLKIDMHKGSNFRPISEWNCYHYTFATVLGVNKPQYTDQQLQQIIKDNNKGFDFDGKHYSMYQGTQLQRQIETEIRRQKDKQITAVASDNKQLIQESQANITKLKRKYKQLNDASGLRPKVERMNVVNYKRVALENKK